MSYHQRMAEWEMFAVKTLNLFVGGFIMHDAYCATRLHLIDVAKNEVKPNTTRTSLMFAVGLVTFNIGIGSFYK